MNTRSETPTRDEIIAKMQTRSLAYDEWRDKMAELQSDRDTHARAAAKLLLLGHPDLAMDQAVLFGSARDALDAHMATNP